MSMRDQYENLDQYAMYDYKDVVNAYGHGEDDAIDCVLEIIDNDERIDVVKDEYDRGYANAYKNFRKAVLALRGGVEQK